jgi:excisionase family DNA binding protein
MLDPPLALARVRHCNGMALAATREDTAREWLPLAKVAEELGVTRSAVYLMVVEHRLEGMQCGARWVVRRSDVERFRAGWQPPPNAGRRLRRRTGVPDGPNEVLALLEDWGEANVEELAEAIGRHPGNVRKYLKLLEIRGQVRRSGVGGWIPAALGERDGATQPPPTSRP